MQIGFIGLGSMGSGMAANLLRAGHTLTLFNRTPDKAEVLVAEGATLAKTPSEAARGDVVITMLADDAVVERRRHFFTLDNAQSPVTMLSCLRGLIYFWEAGGGKSPGKSLRRRVLPNYPGHRAPEAKSRASTTCRQKLR